MADLPSGFYLEDAVDASFVQPVTVAFAPGGRMFVVEKRGIVRTVQNGVLQQEPFLDLRDEVLSQHDRGLLGIAVDPDFETNRRVYVSYTVDHQATSDRDRLDAYARVTSYAGRLDNPNIADPSSRRVLIGETFATGIPSCYRSHTIGTLQFGADGTLLVGTGDGASYNRADPGNQYEECFGPDRLPESEDVGAFRSQRVESLAGKVLRIDPETGLGLPSNPFWTGDADDTASKVWALGFRNPFRFSIDAESGAEDAAAGRPGRLYIGDVGWSAFDEIDVSEGGENFGWPCREGPVEQPRYTSLTPATNGCSESNAGVLTEAAYAWNHHDASRSNPPGMKARAIVSGDIYRGTKYPGFYRDAFFYGDYAQGWTAVSRLDGDGRPEQQRVFSPDMGPVVAYVYDDASEYLHLVNVFTGRVQRLRHTGEAANAAPVAQASATPTMGGAGLRVQFSPAGSFDPDGDDLSYSWAFGDGTRSDARAPVHAYDSPGVYDAELVVSDGVLTTRIEVAVTVRAGSPPSIRITSPTASTRGAAGETVRLSASVSDPDQSSGSLFVRWTVTQIHDNHVHLDVFTGSDPTTTFTVPEHGLPGEQVYYRVRAEVRDATGLTSVDEVALFLEGDSGETDVSLEGDVIASVRAPRSGRGSDDLEVVRDGVTPAPGATSRLRQFATYTGSRERDLDWVGYAFGQERRFARVRFQEGLHQDDGGWFETAPRVQVRQGGDWRDVTGLTVSPEYRADDGRGYDAYSLAFAPTTGDAVRVIGPPGGDAGYVSVGELRAFVVDGPLQPGGDLPDPWASADIGDPDAEGRAFATGDVISVTGGGDIWQDADRFHFAYRPWTSDGTAVVRVASLTDDHPWHKAALMVRASLDAGSAHASLVVSNLGTHLQGRLGADESSVNVVDAWGRTAPTWLRLDRAGSLVRAYVSDDGVGWREIGDVRVPDLEGNVLIGLGVSAADYGTGTTGTAQFSDFALSAGLPAGWTSGDIGDMDIAGSAQAEGDTFVLTGSGDIWQTADRFHFASRVLEGDGAIVARVEEPVGPHQWSKAGLMVRRSTAPGSPHAWVGLSQIGLHLQYRLDAGGASAGPFDRWSVPSPIWLRMERSGTEVRTFRSDDGETWTAFGTVDVTGLGTGPVLAGLAVSAADYGDGFEASGRFTSVDVLEAGGISAPPVTASQSIEVGFGIDAVYPNPLRGRATVLATLPADTDLTLALYDVLGRRVASETFAASAGVREIGLDLEAVPAGAYILRLSSGEGETAVRQVTVVR